MKKFFIFLSILSITSMITNVVAQEDTIAKVDSVQPSKWKQYWKISGVVGIKITQTQLINWAAGGNSNFSGIAYANVTLNYKQKKHAWTTNLDTDFGAIYSSDFQTYRWRKGSDKLNFSSTYGYEISPQGNSKSTWYIASNGSFKSQYTIGYGYPADGSRAKISNWLSPSHTSISIGVNWKWTDLISLYFSPLGGLITSCTDSILRPANGFPSDKLDKTAIATLGMTFRAGVTYAGVKNLKIATTFALYTPYTDKEQKFGYFNVDWDVMITYQFLKVLNVSLTTNLKYYPKVRFPDEPDASHSRVQFQEVFGLGIGYSF